MNHKLKEAVEHLAGTYASLDPPVARKDLFLEIAKFLSYLTAANGALSEGETQFINTYLDMGLRARDLGNFITSYDTYGTRFGSILPGIYESHLGQPEVSMEYLSVIEALGKECIISDQQADEEEVSSLTGYLNMLNDAFNARYPEKRRHPEVVRNTDDKNAFMYTGEKKDEEKSLEELLEEMDELIGLDTVKQNVYSLVHLQDIQMERDRRGMKRIPITNHLVFMGNPGTGKTTIARMIARIYYKLGVIESDSFVEVDRSGLVAGYVGQTAIEVRNVMDTAKDGVLFIDEAYSLSTGLKGDYGHEAIQTILKRMEDERDRMVVIVAGYPQLMETFLESNPGLDSRFSKKIFFPDYTPDELIEILKYMARKNGIIISDAGLNYAHEVLKKRYEMRDENFANAREVRNMFEAAVVRQADRLYGNAADLSDEELQTIEAEDFRINELIIESGESKKD
ncbi:MAG: AAA family ATPase [Lachnospiraceae bacterium]|nr:AAA family ATPase [Lachnospiraceae bacterium]